MTDTDKGATVPEPANEPANEPAKEPASPSIVPDPASLHEQAFDPANERM